jgi:hypothetical protein
MKRHSMIPSGAATAVVLALSHALPAQTFTKYGAGCPGAAGTPAISNQGLPVLGTSFGIEVTNGRASAPAFLVLGFLQQSLNLGFIGAPQCTLLLTPDVAVAAATNANGAASVPFAIPADPALNGALLYAQWAALDPAAANPIGLTLSDAGCAQLGNLPPLSVVPNSIQWSGNREVGTTVTLRLQNAGTQDPDDLCMLLMAGDLAVGVRFQARLRVQSLVKDPLTCEDVLTAQLATPGVSQLPGLNWNLGLMRGTGGTPAVPASGALGAAPAPWSWNGFGLPGNGTMGPSPFDPLPSPTMHSVPFTYDSSTKSLSAAVPAYPFGNGGLYPSGASIKSDAHGDLVGCGPSSMHFDKFLDAVPVVTANVTAQTIANDHVPQIRAVFDQLYGPGKFQVTAEAGAVIRIKAIGGCTLSGAGGSIVIVKP